MWVHEITFEFIDPKSRPKWPGSKR
jgi:hypothetical protein